MNTNPHTDSELDALYAAHAEKQRELDRFATLMTAVQWIAVGIAAGIITVAVVFA